MTFKYLNVEPRNTDYWLGDVEGEYSVEVDLSDEFINRYREAVDNYDGVQAELELMFNARNG